MLSEIEWKNIRELEETAEKAGGYLATPKRPLVIEADFHALSNYCREKGIKPTDLTDEEYNIFVYDEPLIYA